MSITDRMDKLIVNITEAQQKRCDLEAQLHSLDSQCLTLETDITSCQHKNGLLSRQIPDILAELTKQREVNASLSGQLEDQIK
ncbi:hypothetical protein B484DRAFT_406490 [Ochromonadaceae sp. CCMP2298]|nr:hypothetical protein B484DRAFT_406490 [Ochromonadaceae sp. CCMP2298]